MPGKPWIPKFIKDLLNGVDVSNDGTFAANSDALLPTQRAVKTYVGAHGSSSSSLTIQANGSAMPSEPALNFGPMFALTDVSGGSTNVNMAVKDLTGASSDYALAVGETAKVTYTNATSVPLHIATSDGQYVITVTATTSPPVTNDNALTLSVNNVSQGTSIGNYAFTIWSGTSAISTPYSSVASAIISKGAIYSAQVLAYTYLTCKRMISQSSVNTTAYQGLITNVNNWYDTTTPWSSLGTLTFPFAQSGVIIIRRII